MLNLKVIYMKFMLTHGLENSIAYTLLSVSLYEKKKLFHNGSKNIIKRQFHD